MAGDLEHEQDSSMVAKMPRVKTGKLRKKSDVKISGVLNKKVQKKKLNKKHLANESVVDKNITKNDEGMSEEATVIKKKVIAKKKVRTGDDGVTNIKVKKKKVEGTGKKKVMKSKKVEGTGEKKVMKRKKVEGTGKKKVMKSKKVEGTGKKKVKNLVEVEMKNGDVDMDPREGVNSENVNGVGKKGKKTKKTIVTKKKGLVTKTFGAKKKGFAKGSLGKKKGLNKTTLGTKKKGLSKVKDGRVSKTKTKYKIAGSLHESKRENVSDKEKKLALDLFGDLTKDEPTEPVVADPLLRNAMDKGKEDGTGKKKRKGKEDKKISKHRQRMQKKKKGLGELKSLNEEESKIPIDPFDIHAAEHLEPEKKPAWVDEDDKVRVGSVVKTMTKARGKRGIKETSDRRYEAELREKFSNVISDTPDWANLDFKKDDSDEDEDIMKKTGDYLSTQSTNLPKTSLEYKQMVDLNSSHTEGALIRAIDFNPSLQIGLVAGTHKQLGAASLYQVDGKTNHRIHSVRFPNFPITGAHFLLDGKRFVVGSNEHSYMFAYDMEASKETKLQIPGQKFEKGAKKNVYVSPHGDLIVFLASKGKICLFDTNSLSLVDVMEAPHYLTSATFNSNGSKLYTHGVSGEVCVWDMNSRVCMEKFYDEGCIFGQSIALAPNNQYLACGSKSGIVNVYDCSTITSNTPRPIKVLSNLTTPVTTLAFNSSSEILAMASSSLANAVKLVHFPSMTIFENFPQLGITMKRTESLHFSPGSGYLAIGNVSGAAPLFRLKHYSSY